ncbi:MAG: hypothetical protein ACR2QK_00565 [Acidimicrobiales bacterium]
MLGLVGLLGLLAVACSVEETMPISDCRSGGSAFIVAQSVSTAELIPCFDPLPDGWEVDTVQINQDGTVMKLDSDRAGLGSAQLHFTEICDPGEAVPVPSEQEGAEAFEFVEQLTPGFRAERYYLFPGGCVRWEFDFATGVSATHSVELQERLTLFTRQFLNASMAENFIAEEL